jgi:serine/threonine-protein kinase RsbW
VRTVAAAAQAPDLDLLWTSASFGAMTLSRHALAADRTSASADWCEMFALPGSQLAISIGDVCGHDEAGARLMIDIRRDIREEARALREPSDVLRAVNERMCRRGSPTYATSVYGIVDIPTQTLAFASAGHPAPLLIEGGRARFLRAQLGDMPLGIQPTLQIVTHRVSLAANALVVFYTDGVVEIDRDAAAGEHRLRDAARVAFHAPGIAAAEAIARHLELPRRKRDDASILTVRTARESSP